MMESAQKRKIPRKGSVYTIKTRLAAMLLALLTVLTGGPALAENMEAAEATTVIGRVTQVSATAITIELGTYTAPKSAVGNSDASSSATVKPKSEAPETTSAPEASQDATGTQDADQPSAGAAPDTAETQPDKSAGAGFTASGETLTFSVTESTAITVGRRNRKGSISDIPVGSILTVKLSGETATSITVEAGYGHGSYQLKTRDFSRHNPRGFGRRNDWNRRGRFDRRRKP